MSLKVFEIAIVEIKSSHNPIRYLEYLVLIDYSVKRKCIHNFSRFYLKEMFSRLIVNDQKLDWISFFKSEFSKKKKKLATIKNLLFIIIRKEENVPAANWRRPKSAKNVAKADQRRTTNVGKDPLMFVPLLPRRDHSLSSRISANYSRWIVNRDAASYNGCLRKDGSQDSTIFASFVVKEWQQTTVFPLVSWIKPWRRWMTFRNGRPIHYT